MRSRHQHGISSMMKQTLLSKTFIVGCLVGYSLRNLIEETPRLINANFLERSTKEQSHNSLPSYEIPPLHHSVDPVKYRYSKWRDPTFPSTEITLDAFNPIHHYLMLFDKTQPDPPSDFPELPFLRTWMHYAEAYHNHFARYRGRDRIVFMEVGVQSGGKIPMLRDYFGPGFVYIGIDINPSTTMFASVDWVTIEIGDSGDETFWDGIKSRYPIVDIFLDDGGHTMDQQRLAMKVMLPHIQPDGVYMCEDLATSWTAKQYGGIRGGTSLDPNFVSKTMQGLIHQSMDWLNAGYVFAGSKGVEWDLSKVPSSDSKEETTKGFQEDWWQVVTDQVKHIHYYNQLVVYEKGSTFNPNMIATVGNVIPIRPSGAHEPVNWNYVMKRVQNFTQSAWKW